MPSLTMGLLLRPKHQATLTPAPRDDMSAGPDYRPSPCSRIRSPRRQVGAVSNPAERDRVPLRPLPCCTSVLSVLTLGRLRPDKSEMGDGPDVIALHLPRPRQSHRAPDTGPENVTMLETLAPTLTAIPHRSKAPVLRLSGDRPSAVGKDGHRRSAGPAHKPFSLRRMVTIGPCFPARRLVESAKMPVPIDGQVKARLSFLSCVYSAVL